MNIQDKICFVMLGNKCNQNCTYCYQNKSETTVLFNENIISTIDSNDRIMFYGGEPLLYFDQIEYIVERLHNKHFINITTNGTLLTSEIVDFINRYHIHISLSHDGFRHSAYRGYADPLATHGDLFEKINSKGLICVVNNLNYNYYNLWEYLHYNKLSFQHTFQHIKYCGTTDKKFLFSNNPNWEKLLDEISDKAIIDMKSHKLSNELLFFKKYFFENQEFCSCYQRYTCIDLAGKHYACHNYKSVRYDNNVFCREDCPAKVICGGGCLCVPNTYDCYLYRTLYKYRMKVIKHIGGNIHATL